ncbi:thioesterase family protein [Virgibacillus sp. 179-BFC.A HS]|uniref:Thioesterase family protein n=1 Tax=Tigheibacillus jepli TaxID=3035914 RepID=A0ABU5CGL4_9BACI|nr:thioesterase family protein [Virgibacillus sp. 179-BFC.A HS]MDY0405421.1 thioesterase family protein [Virgibacillus sp. 179-BFC.A HS]
MKKIPYIDNFDEWKNDFSFSIPIKIRFSETDMFGHVNNVSPFIYFEEGRIAYLQSMGLFNMEDASEGMPIVADLQCDYLKQMYFGDQLTLYVKTASVGNTSLDIHYMIKDEKDEVSVTGRGRMVYINPASGKPIALPQILKEKL